MNLSILFFSEKDISSTGWGYLCVKVRGRKHGSKKYTLCNMYVAPCEIVEDINIFNREFLLVLSYMKATKQLLCVWSLQY